jgi:CRISPR system Cascade subunit CasB
MITELHQRAARFAGFLHSLESEENRNARAILADLRTGLGRNPGEAPRALRHIVPFLDERPDRWSDRWFFLAGTLFPLQRKSLPDGEIRRSLGGSFGRIRGDLSESTEARFLALLSADSADLPELLRGAISLLASRGEGVGVDWARLVIDLANWDHPERNVQERWAREFYRADNENTKSEGEE